MNRQMRIYDFNNTEVRLLQSTIWTAVLIPLWCEIAKDIICGIISTIEKRRRKNPIEELKDEIEKAIHKALEGAARKGADNETMDVDTKADKETPEEDGSALSTKDKSEI